MEGIFKSRLTTHYIIPFVDEPEKLKFPPDEYRFINPNHWTAFVAERTSPKFLAMRKKQQERRALNIYPHRMSRGGYAHLKKALFAELSDDKELERYFLWIKGRETKEGKIIDETTMHVYEKIYQWKKKKEKGEIYSFWNKR